MLGYLQEGDEAVEQRVMVREIEVVKEKLESAAAVGDHSGVKNSLKDCG